MVALFHLLLESRLHLVEDFRCLPHFGRTGGLADGWAIQVLSQFICGPCHVFDRIRKPARADPGSQRNCNQPGNKTDQAMVLRADTGNRVFQAKVKENLPAGKITQGKDEKQ